MRVGNVDVHVIRDGEFRSDGGGVFGLVPRVLWEKFIQADSLNRVPMVLNCLLILSEGLCILVDTGYGDKLSPKRSEQLALNRGGGIVAGLAEHGLELEDIDIVINTHLHSDHSGGNSKWCDGSLKPTFPNAVYWVQRKEWAAALSPNERTRATYLSENLSPVEEQLRLLDGDTHVTSEVRCVVTRGHTRAHQSVIIESQGQHAIYMGEVAPLTISLERLAWIAAYDVEPLESLETRRRVRDWVRDHQATLFFNHDARCSVGRLCHEDERYHVEPFVLD